MLLDDVDPYRDCYGLDVASRLSAEEFTYWQEQFAAACASLTKHSPAQARVLAEGLACLVPLRPHPESPSLSASSRHSVGSAATTRPTSGDALAEAMVHEFRHSVLWAILGPLNLVTPSNSRFYAPWRSDPRPARGLIHGIYAYLGLLQLWQQRRLADDFPTADVAHFDFALWRRGVATAVDELVRSGELTPAGLLVVRGMRQALGGLLKAAVPSQPLALAEDAALDTHIAWRIRNSIPDPSVATELSERWIRGEPVGLYDRASILGASRRFTSLPRPSMARSFLRSGSEEAAQPAEPAVAADRLLIERSYELAAQAYSRVIRTDPAPSEIGDSAWAGLAVALARWGRGGGSVMIERPEIVRATYYAIKGRADGDVDPIELAAWFDATSASDSDG